jgi:hypothetical protein
MLRSWRSLQRHLSPGVLEDEERATLSAMRQLRLLRGEGAGHDKG